MDPVTPAPAAPTAPAARAAAKTATAEAGEAAGAAATDFQTFLTLLTTQLRNQDPLKPMESTEFVAQLATFSGVEQQIRTNDRLEAIFEALGGGTSAGLAAWIGREVRAPAKAGFSGVPVEIETTPLADADAATLVVTNDFGQVVARRTADPRAATLSWDGRDELGQGLPYGQYSFAVERYRDGALVATDPGEVFGAVTEVRIEDGAQVLVLEGGAKVPLETVTALR
jgi:flagellar basal-body rod modification protein FlgD